MKRGAKGSKNNRAEKKASSKKERQHHVRIIKDPIAGWPVLTAGPEAPKLTHKQVQEILDGFP